jgi:hypothetical protein
MNMPHRTPPSRKARNQLIRRRPCGQLGEPPQVLGDGRKCEFKLGAAGAPEAQSDETQDALQVGEKHLDLFAIVTRSRPVVSDRRVEPLHPALAIKLQSFNSLVL